MGSCDLCGTFVVFGTSVFRNRVLHGEAIGRGRERVSAIVQDSTMGADVMISAVRDVARRHHTSVDLALVAQVLVRFATL